ncbi:MAG: transglutaminase-like domain-containing protein [Archangium sp.]|nr:transglutaminase-like domain-containing protein [Archangium sp.]
MRRVALVLTMAAAVAFAGPPKERFLHELKLDSQVQGEARWDQVQLVVELEAGASNPLFVLRRGLRAEGGVVTLRSLSEAVVKDAVLPRHRADSWVMDFKEPIFTALWAEVQKQAGNKPSVADLVAFTGLHVSKKSLGRGFDLASKVAATREGDCSEHAVLLAALLRHYGFPARVMLGTVLVNFNGAPAAFGHAWVETFAKGAWKTADAILPSDLDVHYLPSAELTDEGPGFGASLVPAVQGLRFKRLMLKAR